MPNQAKQNLVYFESPSMQGLYKTMQDWQAQNRKRLLSLSVKRDSDMFCCLALTNPSEVVLMDSSGANAAKITDHGEVLVFDQSGE